MLMTHVEAVSASQTEIFFPPKRILAPIDGSDNASRALSVAIEIAKRYDADLLIMTVTRRDRYGAGMGSDFPGHAEAVREYYDEMDKLSDHLLEDSLAAAMKAGVTKVKTEAIPEFESVPQQILEVSTNRSIDLIVLGTRGLGGFKRLLLGSVSSAIVAHSRSNVLVVR